MPGDWGNPGAGHISQTLPARLGSLFVRQLLVKATQHLTKSTPVRNVR